MNDLTEQFSASQYIDSLIEDFTNLLNPEDFDHFNTLERLCTKLQERISSFSEDENKEDAIRLCEDNLSEIKEKYKSFIDSLTSFSLKVSDIEEKYPADSMGSSSDILEQTIALANEFDNSSINLFKKYAKALDLAVGYYASGSVPNEDCLNLIAEAAKDFESSNDPMLIKQASVLDELLLTLAAPKDYNDNYKMAEQSEIDRIIAKNRIESGERAYKSVKESLDKQNNVDSVAKAVEVKTKQYRPLEASLNTRYCPDHPGVPIIRVGDSVVQCSLDKKVYNWREGFQTMKGNKIPGGSVDLQIQDMGAGQDGQMMFDTRDSLMTKAADAYLDALQKRSS